MYVQNLISKKSTEPYEYNAASRFIDGFCAINNDDKFSKLFKRIYPGGLQLKLKYSKTYATFLDLDIKIENGIFVYKLFDKREKFLFFIVHMPHFQRNIPSTILYGSISSDFLRIARSTLKQEHFLSRASEFIQKCYRKEQIKAASISRY